MSKNQSISFHISGMHCASCASNIQRKLRKIDGVSEANVNYANEQAVVTYDEYRVNKADITQAVSEVGYSARLDSKADTDIAEIERTEELSDLKLKLMVSGVLSAILMASMIPGLPKIFHDPRVLWILATPVQFWAGKRFYHGAWSGIKNFSANMDTLVAMGTSAAYFFSAFVVLFEKWLLSQGLEAHVYFEASAAIITFILLGKYLEIRAKAKTSTAIKELLNLQAKSARIKQKGVWVEVPLEDVIVGDVLQVKPGEKVPVDGKVLAGESSVDEAMVTGESFPVSKSMGDTVIGSTINQSGIIEIKATKVGNDTMLAMIISLVQKAQGSRPPIQALVDTVASYFVPVVITLSIVTLGAWWFFGPEPKLLMSLVSMINVLIIACPCALGLATPTSLMVGIGRGAQNGILIKDAQVLEIANKIKAVAFDKTGTLTQGKPEVQSSEYAKAETQKKIDAAVLAVESLSHHPLAHALVNFVSTRSKEIPKVSSFKDHAGKGVSAKVGKDTVLIGTLSFLQVEKIKIDSKLQTSAEQWQSQALSVAHVAMNEKHVGAYGIADTLRESSVEVISTLKELGITPVMVTGDNAQTANAIAKELDITEVKSQVLPADKEELIRELRKEHGVVAMVGDGINDAPALATADIGIAMGSGTDIAMESADMVLMKPSLMDVVKALKISQATITTIKENLFWAFIYNILSIPVAMGVLHLFGGPLLDPMIAGLAMSFSSVSVVLNALRLKRRKV
ncbi:copper-translocating P-type ATPase [Candidatus Woesebacteria bacterium]|nr:copper-translocating P-type ATPase [Candidatus Woesebacteria bacterium]